ncbi:alpha/beta fold hydrolase [Corynebacterium tapiri]
MTGITTREHRITVDWDRDNPQLGTLEIFARELSRDDSLPFLLYLQGGPGFPSPRPVSIDGWLNKALQTHRVVLLDQRGTGRSGRIDRFGEPVTAEHLKHLRASDIVADAEALRRHLGVEQWDLLGQSFGGFCITAYLSQASSSVRYAFLTGGLPATGVHADEVYRATYQQLARRHQEFYEEVECAEQRVRELCHHLDNAQELLPTGERLSSRRLRTIGIDLGRGTGIADLAALLESPFHTVQGEKRLRGDFLSEINARVSFESAPLYAVIHESIYGGVAPGATNWSAHRMREEIPGFEENADPLHAEQFYLTGEHIFPWQFEEDPALRPFAAVAEELALVDDWSNPYDLANLEAAETSCAAAAYPDDCFVPINYSLETASHFGDIDVWQAAEYHHNGLRQDGERIFGELLSRVNYPGR